MKFEHFKKLSFNEKWHYAESLTDLSLEIGDHRERQSILSWIVYAKDEEEFLIAIDWLNEFEESYREADCIFKIKEEI